MKGVIGALIERPNFGFEQPWPFPSFDFGAQ